MSLRLIIADDHKIMREGLRSLLEKEPGIEIVAEADNGLTVIPLSAGPGWDFCPHVCRFSKGRGIASPFSLSSAS